MSPGAAIAPQAVRSCRLSRRTRLGFGLVWLTMLALMPCPAHAGVLSLEWLPPLMDRLWLASLLGGTAPVTVEAVRHDPEGFKASLRAVLGSDSDLTVLVDKQVGIPAGYVPPDLVVLSRQRPALSVKTANPPLRVRVLMLPGLQAMSRAANQEGIRLDISSAYRSYQYQKELFARYVRELGESEAARQSARAGHSQHQLGLAIDFGSITPEFADTRAGRWLFAHAAEFGFSLSYPEGQEGTTGYMYEPWHYRYIGLAAAALQGRYFGGSQQAMLVFLDRNAGELKARLLGAGTAAGGAS
jgi:D-alanyl-D-alanine carboxypeptidase